MNPERPDAAPPPETAAAPLAQRIMDNPILLLVLGLVVMFVFYTGWGMWEILSLSPAPLP